MDTKQATRKLNGFGKLLKDMINKDIKTYYIIAQVQLEFPS